MADAFSRHSIAARGHFLAFEQGASHVVESLQQLLELLQQVLSCIARPSLFPGSGNEDADLGDALFGLANAMLHRGDERRRRVFLHGFGSRLVGVYSNVSAKGSAATQRQTRKWPAAAARRRCRMPCEHLEASSIAAQGSLTCLPTAPCDLTDVVLTSRSPSGSDEASLALASAFQTGSAGSRGRMKTPMPPPSPHLSPPPPQLREPCRQVTGARITLLDPAGRGDGALCFLGQPRVG